MIGFAGDTSKLSFRERAAASAAQTISGQALPYATLMYIWGGKVAVDSITVSSRSSRIRMLAVAADDQGIGSWHTYTRNLVADFKRDSQGKGAHAFEITRDKKVVWTYADHDFVKILTCVHVFDK